MTQGSNSETDTSHEWRFSVEDVGPEAETEAEQEPPESDPIEPEPISLEHAAFVGIGILLTLGIMATAL